MFRTEFSKIAAVLCNRFGMEHIELAEDIASETFLAALETWTYKGIPENPVAWLYAVAKNKALNYMNRKELFDRKIAVDLKHSYNEGNEIDLSDTNITDSQLKMLFTLCHPCISTEAQIGLSLRILCGFGIEEIANAFLTNKETINKRLSRAKEKLRQANILVELPGSLEISNRLDTVLITLYLLFNEGYYSESRDAVLREDLCLEAMRLVYLLISNEQTNLPKVNALMSLMCFHSSRFRARKDKNGEMVLYEDQDENLWNEELIHKGVFYLNCAAQGTDVSKYHLEAGIAYWHTVKTDSKEKWEHILQLYNHLLVIEYSPIAALNRTYALSKANSVQEAITEAEKLKLHNNHYYYVLLGALYTDIDRDKAISHYQQAIHLVKNQSEKQGLQKKLDKLYNA